MTDLKHWDFADSFTAQEMAMLIIGFDPAIETNDAKKIKPIIDRIRRSVDGLFDFVRFSDPWDYESGDGPEPSSSNLFPDRVRKCWESKNWDELQEWCSSKGFDGYRFGIETFDRKEIVRWLAVMGFDSVYDFSKSTSSMQISPSPEVVAAQTVENQLHPRTEKTYRNIIAALLEIIAGDAPRIKKHPDFENEAALILYISEKYGDYPGISKRTLEGKFPEAKQSLKG